eukprot:GHVT01029040.1.p1 GENE.GHVT01029040.1~~GHVT01029040.1.p1  ORF type:complete len:233 (+),score=53.52 GHVT01029040.1:97-699(+)
MPAYYAAAPPNAAASWAMASSNMWQQDPALRRGRGRGRFDGTPGQDNRAHIPCRYWPGNCKNGYSCAFLHAAEAMGDPALDGSAVGWPAGAYGEMAGAVAAGDMDGTIYPTLDPYTVASGARVEEFEPDRQGRAFGSPRGGMRSERSRSPYRGEHPDRRRAPAPGYPGRRRAIICKYWKGLDGCRNGDHCPFLHPPTPTQ